MEASQGVPRPIHIGVMCNGRRFPAWQASALRSMSAVPGAQISLLIVRDAAGGPSKLARLRDRSHLLWTMFNKAFIERRSWASRSVDLSSELAGVPEIRCRTEPVGRFGERLTDRDLDVIRRHDLDVILRFSFGIIKGGILTAARYGVWSFHHGDEREFRGRPPGFWELVEGRPVVGAILQRLTERLDGGVVLHRGFFRTTPASYRRTRDDAFLGSAVWPSIVIRQIQLGDTAALEAPPSKTEAPIRYDPTNITMLRFLLRQAAAFVWAQVRGVVSAAKWTIGVADAPITAFLDGTPPIRWLDEVSGPRYLADPFAMESDGRTIVLAEDYDYAAHRGVISAIDLAGGGHPRVVLDTGVHSSYPFMFRDGDDIYCVPETYQARAVRLYRAVKFPDEWELVTSLVDDFAALDATVFHHDERWWLFCTDHREESNSKLHVFWAESLEGPWAPHELNPVKTDVRSARPAGTPFVKDGTMYRPAQDASVSYGGGVSLTRIDVLTPTRFAETVVARVAPPTTGRYRKGLHTLSAVGNVTMVDGRRDAFIWHAMRRELTSRLRKLRG